METTNALHLPITNESHWDELDERFKPGLIANVRARAAANGMTLAGHAYIRAAASMPSRCVKSTPKSSSGSYPSTKLGVSVGFESRTLELPTITVLENDPQVLAYFDQPPGLAVRYKREGRTRCYRQTPDFLVVRYDESVLIECKPLAKIAQRNASDPGFYVREGDHWVCPALQAAARDLGMRHEVWCETSFSVVRLRNFRMLDDYMLRGSAIEGYDDALHAILRYLNVKARANVEELLKALDREACVDHLYTAIARGDVAFDWEAAPLSEQRQCFVYRDQGTLKAFDASEQSKVAERDRIVPASVELAPGVFLDWDGAVWECENAGATSVALCKRGPDAIRKSLPRDVVTQLIASGVMKSASTSVEAVDDSEAHERIAKASETDLRTANLRHARIAHLLAPGARAPLSRTERRHVASYRQAEASYGNGYIGLLPGFSRSGNRKQRLMMQVLDIAVGFVKREYLTATNINKKAVFGLIEDSCREQGLPPPSYSWLCRFIDRLPAHAALRARKGSKGAYALEAPQVDSDDFDKMAPERAFERAHIDHTVVDVETLFGETSEPLGRCVLTVMIDHFSRRILAHWLSYDAPSHRSVLMVLRKCARRHGRLPESIAVDGGKEFRSVYMETTCALYKIKILRRPTAKGRFGAQMERMFGTTNTQFFHFLAGNTQLRTNVRQLTAEVDPDTHAVWTLPELNKALSHYFYEIYETLPHRELLVTPRFAFDKSLERHGKRPERRVVYNELFRITTSPAPARGSAKVQRDGVKIHYQYFYSPQLQRHIGKDLKVRYDPFDKSVAWAFADGRWLRLKSRNQELFKSLTEHDVDLAVSEWRKRRSDVEKTRLSEPVLVKFLKELRQTEVLLLARRRAAEERRLRHSEGDEDGYDEDVVEADVPTADTQKPAVEPHVPARADSSANAARNTSISAYHASFAELGDAIESMEAAA